MSGFNAATWLVDRHVQEGHGYQVAVRVHGAALTYEELKARVCAAASTLRDLGARPEERVLLVMLDGVEFVAAFLGAMRLGAVPVPVNPLLRAADLAPIAGDARARVVVASAERMDVAKELTADAREIETVLTGEELLAGGGDADAYDTSEESPGFWLCTSGTTGTPKLAMHRHADLKLVADGYAREVLGIGADDVCFSVAPLFHAYGLGNSLTFPLSVGATTVLEPTRPPTPALVAATMERERPTLFFCVPTFYAALCASDLPADTFSSVRIAVSAGEPLPAEIFVRFRDRFGVEILDGIGSTEMTHIFVSNRRGDARAGTSGTPVGGYDVRVTDDEARPVPDGEPGHLWVRGASAATGYWCRSDATRRTFVGPWTRTGDMYVRSDDGFYTYLGRSDDMFKVGGEWVSPAEVEAALIEHPGVLEAAVVGEPDADGLLKPVAFVVASSDPPPGLEDHCRERLAGFKRPRRITFVDELPKTATGKIQRYKLRS